MNAERCGWLADPIVQVTALHRQWVLARRDNGIKLRRQERLHGARLLPELTEHLNPLPVGRRWSWRRRWPEKLARSGVAWVAGGH